MAFLIDQLNNSGLFAQSAYSAGVATCDSEGNVITATYLTGVDLTPYQTTADMINYQTVSGMSDYATTGELANKLDATAFNIPDSANWNSNYETVQNNSATWNTVTNKLDSTAYTPFDPTYMSGAIDNKLDTTAFSDVSGTFLTAHQSLDGYATTAWVDSQGYLTAHQPISADEWNNVYETVNVYSASWTGGESSPTAAVDSNGSIDIVSSNNTVYFDVNGTWFNDAVNSAYTGSQGDANVNAYVHNNSATINNVNTTVQTNSSIWDNVNNKLDTTAFSDVSGTFLTAHQSLEGYATTAWVDSQGYLTELPASAEETLGIVNTNSGIWDSVTGKEDTISYGYSAGAISSINGSAIMGETIPYEVYGISAGENVTIWEDNNTLWISAEAGQGGDVEVNDLVHSNSAIWDEVTNKLDTTAFSIPTSSNWNDVYNTVNSNSGLWSAGDTEVNTTVQNNSATWNNVSNKLDTTSFSDVSGSFLTAHQSLEDYATTAWVDSQGYLTAHQPISAEEWNVTYDTVQSNSANWGQGSTFTGVDTDSTLTGNGKDTPLGVAEVQTLSSDETISITSANDVVTLGVNETWFNNVNTTVQTNSGTWEGYGSDIAYISATIGDVESLLAQL